MKQSVIVKFNRWIIVSFLSLLLVLCYYTLPVFSRSSPSPEKVFESVWNAVEENFFDPNFNGVDWEKMRWRYQPQAAQAKSTKQLAKIINQIWSLD